MPVKGFDLAAVLGNVSKLDTGKDQIEYIDLDRIDKDPNNFYSLTGIDELVSSIELCGLQQPIRVRAGESGRYIIVSGHRRWTALQKLAGSGKKEFSSVPCIVEHDDASPAMRELRLIFANSGTRVLTSAELSKQAERVEALLYQLKGEGVEFPGRMRDQVAAACKTSASKLARLKVIREKLTPEYQALFQKNKMSEQAAYTMAGLPPEFQQRCAKVLKGAPCGFNAELIRKKAESGCTYDKQLRCPSGKSCTHSDAFLRHDLTCGSYDACGGTTCCLKCKHAFESYCQCENACARVKEKRSEKAQAEKQRQQNAEAKRQTKAQIRANAIMEYFQRMKLAADAAGHEIDDKLLVSLGADTYSTGGMMKMVKGEYQAGSYDDGSRYLPNAEMLAAFCRMMDCSAEYILGLSPDMDAEASAAEPWQFGDPTEPGYYWCLVGPLKGGGKLAWWSGSSWQHPCAECDMDLGVVCWCKSPELPDSVSWCREKVD